VICPKCNAEYRPGVLRCADCDIALIPGPTEGEIPRAESPAAIPEWVRLQGSRGPAELPEVTSALDAAGIPFTLEGAHAGALLALPTTVWVPKERREEAEAVLSSAAVVDRADMAETKRRWRSADRADRCRAATAGARQGYRYGRFLFFVAWTGLVDQLIGVIRSPGVSVAGLYDIAVGIGGGGALLVALAKGGPWAWYVILAFHAWGLTSFVGRLAYWGMYGQPTPWMRDHRLFGWSWMSLGLLIGILTFGYFYRRRTMFGAVGRFRWLERRIPSLVGAQTQHSHAFDDRALISGRPLVLSIGAGLVLNVLHVLFELLLPTR
jgi:Putative prokaryotic signal transducing protein